MRDSKNALIVVDLQHDFMPTGALPVKNGDEVVAVANLLMPLFDVVVATMDWHPPNHGSFASQYANSKPGAHVVLAGVDQVLWPDHCVQDTFGAQVVESLNKQHISMFFHKGVDPQIDSYSTFFDNAHKRETGLHQFLKQKGVERVFLLGLATDYCVKFSVLDALHLGYQTFVVTDGCRGVELEPGDSKRALDEMNEAGAHLVMSIDVAAKIS